MKNVILVVVVSFFVSANLQAQDTVSTTTVAPTADLLASQTVAGEQYLVDAARDPGQGQTFSLANDFMIEAVTVEISADTRGAQGTAENAAALSLNIYELPVDPVTGDPVLTLDATTLLGSFSDSTAATFDATAAVTAPLYLTFDLDPASTDTLGTLSANTLYAFTITSTSTTDPSFRITRSPSDEFVDGNGIFTGGNNTPTLRADDDAVFFLQGTSDSDCILADVDMNGVIDFNDIPFFVDVLLMGPFQCEADCDENGLVDFNDIPFFVDILLNP